MSAVITEESGRKLAIQESEISPTIKETNERILVPISNPQTIVHLMDFAIMVKDTKSSEPIYSLTVVKDNEEADELVHKSNEMLEEVVKHASGADNEVKIITRIDLSVVSGITRALKETIATDLIMGWSTRITTTDRLFGTKIGSLLGNVWKNIFVCHFVHPINTSTRMIVLMPAYVEYEKGFGSLVKRVHTIALEAGVKVELYCTQKTNRAFKNKLEMLKSSIKIQHHLFNHLEDMYLIKKKLTKNDLLLVVSARKRTISHE